MFVLNPLPAPVDPALLELLVRAEPAVIGHFRHTGFMVPAIRAHFQDRRVAGTAITVRVPGMDGAMVHYAIGQARPGDFIVIDRCGDETIATLGGAVAYAAKVAGVAGIVVDGLVTDLGELRQYGVPVWSRGTSAVTVKSLGLGGEFCVPVTCGSVAVNPGDAILADENGVLVIPVVDIEASAQRALKMMSDEKLTLKRLDGGEKYPDIMGTSALIAKAMGAQA
ncbi:4-hydroxy-4-methyl-2-oxoglutarate aldolase [compost metagenome]|uniref:Putative 4-hydroxy-4-methyl-2-oxoglutarate aldolase n=1 Tax=Variovorax boronicumulans TaxID=436515 RepID=A0A250DHF1_9BURK|nr:RraA family protein [Variovorax boronicumulans]ATA53561.1 4-hydroxy-4-methyl-2-oxoglutarate aldolase [Variovorax boronicumulans]